MKHRRVRVDTFSSENNIVRVKGRQGYEQNTDVWVSKEAEVVVVQGGQDTNDSGFNILGGNQNQYVDGYELDQLNLTGTVELELARNSISKGLENLKIVPVGARSYYDAFPKTQSKLLPTLFQRVPSNELDSKKNISLRSTATLKVRRRSLTFSGIQPSTET